MLHFQDSFPFPSRSVGTEGRVACYPSALESHQMGLNGLGRNRDGLSVKLFDKRDETFREVIAERNIT